MRPEIKLHEPSELLAAASSGENPRSSNTFRSRSLGALFLVFCRNGFSPPNFLHPVFRFCNVAIRRLVRLLLEAVENVYPFRMRPIQKPVPKTTILASQLTDAGEARSHRAAVQSVFVVIQAVQLKAKILTHIIRPRTYLVPRVALPSDPAFGPWAGHNSFI